MEQTVKTQHQQIIDNSIHTAIKTACFTPDKMSVPTAIQAFSRLPAEASDREAEYHKSEYALCFIRLINNLQPWHKRYTPTLIQLTDWFISKSHKKGDVPYKKRIKTAIAAMQERKLPISAGKKEEWDNILISKRKLSLPQVLPDPDLEYRCCLGLKRSHRPRPRDY